MKRLGIALFAILALAGVATATSWTKTDTITSSSGAAVDFPAGLTIAEQGFTPNGVVLSGASSAGAYVTSTNVIAASSSPINFVQVGNNVHVFGETAITATAAGVISVLQIPLPVARTAGNFVSTRGASGWCGQVPVLSVTSGPGVVAASTGAVLVNCTVQAQATGTTKLDYNFDYVLTP